MFTVFGGKILREIDLTITGQLPITLEQLKRNLDYSRGLGLKGPIQFGAAERSLAVVGGGPSINQHVDTLKAWDGDVWAINGAYGWCKDRGIKATFLAVDPHPIVKTWAVGVERAILATQCDPSVFEHLKDADVTLVEVGEKIKCGSSAATVTPHLAAFMAYRNITLFGCESSYAPDKTHAYMKEDRPDELIVMCGNIPYLTAPDFYMQAKELSYFIRELPEFLKQESGGLLGAMVKDQSHWIMWVSEEMAKGLTQIERAA